MRKVLLLFVVVLLVMNVACHPAASVSSPSSSVSSSASAPAISTSADTKPTSSSEEALVSEQSSDSASSESSVPESEATPGGFNERDFLSAYADTTAFLSEYEAFCAQQQQIALEALEGKQIKEIFCSTGLAGFLTEDGMYFVWGNNNDGRIGNGWFSYMWKDIHALPTPIYLHCDFQQSVISLDEFYMSGAITQDGSLYTWGGELSGYTGHSDMFHLTPTKVEVPGKVEQYIANASSSLILLEDGTVYRGGFSMEEYGSYETFSYSRPAWHHGYDLDGVYTGGDNVYLGASDPLEKLELDFSCIKVDTSLAHLFLSDAGEVYILGMLMGNYPANERDLLFPEITKLPFPERIVDMEALGTNVAALGESGKVYLYGHTGVGLAGEQDILLEENLYLKTGLPPVQMLEGSSYTLLALGEDNKLYVWGLNQYRVVDAEAEDRAYLSEPRVKEPSGKVIDIAMGEDNGAFLLEDGSMYMWGGNLVKQIYGFEGEYTDEPVRIPVNTAVKNSG